MTTDSTTTFTSTQKRQFRSLAKTKFRRVRIPPIDYDSQLTLQHLFFANLARSWLGESKSGLGKKMAALLADLGDDHTELLSGIMGAAAWFRAQAEIIDAALARSAVTSAQYLDDTGALS